MAKVKLLLSAVTLAAFSSLPAMAQSSMPQTSAPQSTDRQSTQQQTLPGNHSDPNATPADANRPAQSGSGDGQQPTNAQPDPGMGQGTGQTGQSKGDAVPVQHTASAPEVANSALRSVRTELVGKLDSKNAKAGDAVVLKTTEKATIANGVVIPKGTKITGQVVEAKPHTDANKNAQLTVQFTKAELKDGQTLPIQSVLQSVGPADSAATSADMGGAPSGVMGGASTQSAGSGTMGGTSASSATNSGSGMTGAEAAGRSQTTQASTGASNSGVATAANGAPAPGTVVAQQGSIQIKTTALPGVLVETNADGKPFSNASGALVGAGQNVHLDGGTRVDLAIADASAKPQNR